MKIRLLNLIGGAAMALVSAQAGTGNGAASSIPAYYDHALFTMEQRIKPGAVCKQIALM